MKKVYGFLAVLVLLTLGLYAGRAYLTPDDAAVNCPTVQRYLDDGYTMDSCFGNAHRYIVEPTGVYEWGIVYIRLHKATGGPNSLETTYVDINCVIQANDRRGRIRYKETSNQVNVSVVY